MSDNTKGNGPDWGTITKWLVIGVVLIVLIFVLKKPLSGLVDGADELKVTKEGFTIHRAKTAVGDVVYSQQKINSEDATKLEAGDANTKIFRSDNNYVLSWPKGIWKKDDQMLD